MSQDFEPVVIEIINTDPDSLETTTRSSMTENTSIHNRLLLFYSLYLLKLYRF